MATQHGFGGCLPRFLLFCPNSCYLALLAGFSVCSSPGKPKHWTLPVYFLGKKQSKSLGVKGVLPLPTYTRPRDSAGPANTGPIAISLRTAPVGAPKAMSFPLPTAVK
jgi:hypothetical protein